MYCECGCGGLAPLAVQTVRKRGYVKGQPMRFIRGHQAWLVGEILRGIPRTEDVRRKISEHHKAAGIRPSFEASSKGAKGKFREQSGSWRGGTTISPNGYRWIYRPEQLRAHSNGYVYEHIIVAEEKLGRSLLPGERVHHCDGDRLNNAPDNLEVFASQAEHLHQHAREVGITKGRGKGWMRREAKA